MYMGQSATQRYLLRTLLARLRQSYTRSTFQLTLTTVICSAATENGCVVLISDHAILVHAPLSLVYGQWTQPQLYPHFMQGVIEVTRPSWNRLVWHVCYSGQREVWEARVTKREQNRCLAWESVDSRANHTCLSFNPVAPDVTLIQLHTEYEPLSVLEDIGMTLGAVSQRVEGDLQRFKELVEGRLVCPSLIIACPH